MRLLPVLLLLSRLLVASSPVAPGAFPEEELLSKIRRVKIDSSAVYRVRELPLQRSDARFYFNEGIIAMLEPIDGRVTGAIFVGEGETLLIPPDASEKRNLAKFTGTPVLNEKFSAAYLRFSDDTAAKLAEGIKEHKIAGDFSVAEFIDEWTPVAQNLNSIYDLRLLDDLLIAAQPAQGDQAGRGFFAAHMFGQRIGAFDITVDPIAFEQINAGQVDWKDGHRFANIWLSFNSVADRQKPARTRDIIELKSYRINASIALDRQLDVTALVEFDGSMSGERMLSFQLSRFLKVASVEWEGQKLQVYQNEGDPQHSNDVVNLLFPVPIERGKHYALTFRYAGNVIADAGHGVLFVGARGIWYPQRGFHMADYDMTFRFPRKLSLAATGDRVEQKEEGEWRISHWKTKSPILVAGFNVGDYQEAEAKSQDGANVVIYMNRELEPALERQRPGTVETAPLGATQLGPRRGAPSAPTVVPPPPPPSAAKVAPQMARELAQVVDFFAKNFGPLPFDTLRISPIPGNFGQGWPGLVYLSTAAYLLPYETTARAGDNLDAYYTSLLPVHEVAHQWWGHAVAPGSYRDEWITEALASYSSLLWLEQKDKNGPRTVRALLARYRQNLLVKHDDETMESAGPLALGNRLNNSHTPNGSGPIFYDKGPWSIHMLRALMRDPKTGSDAAFFRFLRALREDFGTRPLTTAALRETAEKFIVPQLNAEDANKGRSLEWFFEQYVYGTGIPEVKVSAKLDIKASRAGAAAAPGKITGTALLEDVEETWVLPVPLFIQTPRGDMFAGTAVAGANGNADDSRFSIKLTTPAQKVLVDPQQTLLAIYK